jgi:hypothetical protein
MELTTCPGAWNFDDGSKCLENFWITALEIISQYI